MSGKGSAPRDKRDDAAFASGWDRIFGKKQDDLRTGSKIVEQTERRSGLPSGSNKRSTMDDR